MDIAEICTALHSAGLPDHGLGPKFRLLTEEVEGSTRRSRSRFRSKKSNSGLERTHHDYDVKMRNLRRFIEEGNKVKVTLRFRGREMAHQELGRDLLKRVESDMADEITVEQFPRMEGRQMVMMLAPKKT